jgi:diguanylate cyclase (GGDEF)-like protein/PAS domain S-box-containing protein
MTDNQQNDSAELERLRRLGEYQILRTPPEPAFDEIVGLAADQFGVPIAFLCLTEAKCNWFKARNGIDLEEVPRSISFCDHTLKGEGVMVVPDATLDERFADSPMVTGRHHIRFYAGITLRDTDGFALGTLAVADTEPRQITEQQKVSLKRLANITMDKMQLRKVQLELRESIAATEVERQQAVSDRALLRQTLDCLPQAVVLVDENNNVVLWNKNYEKMFPELAGCLKPGASLEAYYREFLRNERYYKKMGVAEEEEWLKDRLHHLNQGDTIVQQNYGDHRWIRYDQHLALDGKKIFVRTDITEDKIASDSFRLLFENNPVPMWVVEKSSLRYIDVNSAALAHYGYTRDQFLKMTLVDIRPQRERERILEDARINFGMDTSDEDWIHLKADGREIIVTTYSKPVKYQDKDAAIVAIIDITERRKHEARVQYLVEHDALTGLPNRIFFLKLLEGSLSKSAENHYYTSIILLDIDDFKGVNDILGHQVGDSLIVAVANRLKECIGDRGVVARLGGDEFVILLGTRDPEEAHIAAIELIEAFENPLVVPDHDLLVRLSAGLSTGLDNSVDASTLLMNTDMALYKAKSDGGGVCRVYEPQMSLQMIARREVEQGLRQALIKDQLVIHYQPLVELAGCKEIGFEALLRWNHPQKGMIPPLAFIPIAETSGMIVPLGSWVLEQACQMATTWQKNLSIAVNISPAQLKSGKLVEAVAGALLKSGLAAHRLELEITESILLEKSSKTLDILRSLKNLGVSIALDDFGTGYSGLGFLNSFPIDKIKIDQSFIKDIGTKAKSLELIRAAINIGKSLGIKTLAEGIETEEQLRILRTLGCQQGQGYLFSRAIPAGEISEGLKLMGKPASKRSVAAI